MNALQLIKARTTKSRAINWPACKWRKPRPPGLHRPDTPRSTISARHTCAIGASPTNRAAVTRKQRVVATCAIGISYGLY